MYDYHGHDGGCGGGGHDGGRGGGGHVCGFVLHVLMFYKGILMSGAQNVLSKTCKNDKIGRYTDQIEPQFAICYVTFLLYLWRFC